MRPIPLIASLALLCGASATAQDASHAAHSAAAGALAPAAAPAGARVFIVEPKDGATVDRQFTVKFGAEGIEVRPAGDTTPNSGHHHLLIDQSEWPMLSEPIPTDDFHKHYGKGQTEDTITLEPGTHTLQLDFADGRHMQFDPPLVSDVVTVHVK